MDGINTSLVSEYDVENLEEDSEITLDVDMEKLYFNMHDAKADWLYTLPQWEELLTKEKREEIEKELVKSLKKLQNNDVIHISRIIDTIDNIQKFIDNVTYEEFKDNDMLVSAVILKFEIVGEIAKNISEELRNKDNGINWKDLIEYRNYLIENYFDVDLITLWEMINNDLVKLKEKLLMIK